MRIENIKDLFKHITFIDEKSRKLSYNILTDLEDQVVVLITTPKDNSKSLKEELNLKKDLQKAKSEPTPVVEKKVTYKNDMSFYKDFFETPLEDTKEDFKDLKQQYINELNAIPKAACNSCARKGIVRKYMQLLDKIHSK